MIKDIFILIGKFLIMLLVGLIIFHLGILSVKPKEIIKQVEVTSSAPVNNMPIISPESETAFQKLQIEFDKLQIEYETFEHYLLGYNNGYRDGYRDGKANE